jgi:hypothetical protein
MIEICALEVAKITEIYRASLLILRDSTKGFHAGTEIPGEDCAAIAQKIGEVVELSDRIGARASLKAAQRLIDALNDGIRLHTLDTMLQTANAAFVDEIEDWHCALLGPQEAELYKSSAERQFGLAAVTSFPGAVFDLEESCKCLALDRGTASVFHLMRVLECVTGAVWRSLPGNQAKQPLKNGWGEYKSEITTFLTSPPWGAVTKPSDWADRKSVYDDIHVDLSAVSNAWRNPTMHIEKVYTPSQARDIFNATKALLRDASEHIDEAGAYRP